MGTTLLKTMRRQIKLRRLKTNLTHYPAYLERKLGKDLRTNNLIFSNFLLVLLNSRHVGLEKKAVRFV